MKYLIKYVKVIGIFGGILLVMSFIFGLLNLIGVSNKVTSVLSVIIMILTFFILGILEGVNASKKGFISGFKIGLIFLFVLIAINFILFQSPLNLSRIIYYLILIISSVFGAIIGINRKKKE